jgi:hypothetical protein
VFELKLSVVSVCTALTSVLVSAIGATRHNV